MEERISASSVKNPEYPLIKGYIEQALIEERDGRPLGVSLKRAAGYMARYIAVWSSMLPSQQMKEVVELDKLVLRSRSKVAKDRQALSYSVRVEKKARELLPGWMGIRQVVKAAAFDEAAIAEQERERLANLGESIVRDNA